MIATLVSENLTPVFPQGNPRGKSPSIIAAAQDAELVRRLRAGHEAAYVEMVGHFRHRIFATAFALVHNRTDAEDLTQETFIRAHRGLANFRGDSSLSTWLYRIATNLSRNHYWYFVRRGRHLSASLDCPQRDGSRENLADLLVAEVSTPSHVAARDEFAEIISGCMAKLEASQREILTMRNTHERSYADIATVLGIAVGTVKSRIARARGNLRRLMVDVCPEFGTRASPSEWFEPRHAPARFKVTTHQ